LGVTSHCTTSLSTAACYSYLLKERKERRNYPIEPFGSERNEIGRTGAESSRRYTFFARVVASLDSPCVQNKELFG
jgi:hypothetical protein